MLSAQCSQQSALMTPVWEQGYHAHHGASFHGGLILPSDKSRPVHMYIHPSPGGMHGHKHENTQTHMQAHKHVQIHLEVHTLKYAMVAAMTLSSSSISVSVQLRKQVETIRVTL